MGGGGAGEVQLQSNSLLLFISHYHAGELLVLACIVQSCILITTTTHAPTQHSPQPTIYRVSGTINVMQAGGSISDNVMSYMSYPDLMSFLQLMTERAKVSKMGG